jgi:serine/threonine protein kinase
MGEVYRAEDPRLGQAVALKLMSTDLATGTEDRARFIDEVRLSRGVTHPNVCRVHDIGDAEGWDYLSMEYVDGESLDSLLRRIGRLPDPPGASLVDIGIALRGECYLSTKSWELHVESQHDSRTCRPWHRHPEQ